MDEFTLEQIIDKLITKATKAQAAIKRGDDGVACAIVQNIYEELRSYVGPDTEAEEMLAELIED